MKTETRIVEATAADVLLILELIRGLAEYEKLSNQVTATEEKLRETLFGPHPAAEVLLGYIGGECAGFALFFQNYSTFLAKPGIFLEDLFVRPEFRGRGVGRSLLLRVGQIAKERNCGRFEWEVLDWNAPAIGFYKSLGAVPMEEWTKYRITGDTLEKFGD
ncbi:MAG TPA: GNAT family N-acetyltransferase [Bryobacteraceae bacterium]|nr:GNAT family N-acetyltransferase [Bryobacteraceae bacterium]